jgi:purine-binding chemotaxis protein CheW
MDLVKIRKKAKNARNDSNENQGEVTPPELLEKMPAHEESTDQSVADEAVSVEQNVNRESAPDSLPVPVAVSYVEDGDPLEALFSFRVDGTLATEEIYLESLTGDEDAAVNDQRQWLTFSLGEEEYAVELDVVNEIIKTREVTEIPRVPSFIRGVISLRGIIVPVFDLSRRLNIGVVDDCKSTRIVVCQKEGKLAGLLVDCINQVVKISVCNIEPPPTVLSGLDRDFVEGVGRVDGRMLILLNLSHVINAELS